MDNNIYTGLWTNWSRGGILGATLTTTKQYGNLIIAFMALFVGFVASRLWRISCLILHRCYSTTADRNAIHHQRQIILRNSQTAESGLLEIWYLFWAWRKSKTRHFAGLLPLALFTASYLTALTAAGGFSSNISSSIGDEVLLNGQDCGVPAFDDSLASSSVYSEIASERAKSAANYVQQCYRTNESNMTTACNKFVRSNLLTHTINTTAECPFQHQICRNPQSTLRLDSGYIDSHDDLGLNAPEVERFAYRYVLHCAALETDNYTSHVEEHGKGWDRYHYGTPPLGPSDNQTDFLDYIYEVQDLETQYALPEGITKTGFNFKLSFDGTRMFRGKSRAWNPISELVRLDGDLSIIFLSGGGVEFIQRMDDDWYRATTPSHAVYNLLLSGELPTWRPDVSASPMGCLEQFQWCNSAHPRERGCGPLASFYDSIYGAAPFFNLADDALDPDRPLSVDATSARFIWALMALDAYPTTLGGQLGILGTTSLASQSSLSAGVQLPLPDNQWHLDVLQWWHVIMAATQTSRELNSLAPVLAWRAFRLREAVVETAQGTTNPEFLPYQQRPLNDHERKICNSQKVRSSAYTSFSCFGLYFTFITGALITITSYSLEPILNCLHRRRQHKSYAHLEWISNNSLQLHRMAQEQLMGQKWDKCTDDIPTTDPEVSLANLDISDPEHPILRKPGPLKVTTVPVEITDTHEGSSSPDRESVHSDSPIGVNGAVSTSSRTSVSDLSWTLDVRMTLNNVSGQFSLEGSEREDDAAGDAEGAGAGGDGQVAVESSMAGRND